LKKAKKQENGRKWEQEPVEKIINSRGLVDEGGETIRKKPRFAEKPHGGMTGRIDTPCRG
jgi:hypothetical protein